MTTNLSLFLRYFFFNFFFQDLLEVDTEKQLLSDGDGSNGNSPLQLAILKSDEGNVDLIIFISVKIYVNYPN